MLGDEDQHHPEERPATSAMAALRPTSDPTRIQRPWTSRRAAAKRRTARAILELDERARAGTSARRARSRRGSDTAVVVSTTQTATKSPIAPSSGRILLERDPVGADRADRAAGVDLDERAGDRCLDEPEPEERQRRPDHDGEEARTHPLPHR